MTATRGTTNRNDRGSSKDRLRRRQWLVDNWTADEVAVIKEWRDGQAEIEFAPPDFAEKLVAIWADYNQRTPEGQAHPIPVRIEKCCRCYHCGRLLTVDTVSPDRIIPGCDGGTYRRGNIRPACGACQSKVGGGTRSTKNRRKR